MTECVKIGIWHLPPIVGPLRAKYVLEGLIPPVCPTSLSMVGEDWNSKGEETVGVMLFGVPGDATITWTMEDEGDFLARHQWNLFMILTEGTPGTKTITATVNGTDQYSVTLIN